jgi:cation transport regulator ChaB
VLKDLIALIKEKNPDNIKYKAKKWVVCYNPITEFMSEAFLDVVKGLNDRGYVSNETTDYICSLGNINYQIEKRNRIREIIDGDLVTMYPKKTVNTEKDITSEEEAQTKITNPDEMTDEEKENRDKKPGSPEVEKYKSSLEQELIQSILESEIVNDDLIFSELQEIKLIENSRWRKKRTTINYIRRGQINPNKFQKGSFKTIFISKTDGIKAVIGKLIGQDNTQVQSYLFEKSKWTNTEVDKWVSDHSNKVTSKVELIGSPYSNISELPKGVKRLPFSAQKIWMAVFNSEYGKNGEVAAIQMAWGAVKKHYHKNIIGRWGINK